MKSQAHYVRPSTLFSPKAVEYRQQPGRQPSRSNGNPPGKSWVECEQDERAATHHQAGGPRPLRRTASGTASPRAAPTPAGRSSTTSTAKGFPLIVYGAPALGEVGLRHQPVGEPGQDGWKSLLSSEQGSVDDLILEVCGVYLGKPLSSSTTRANHGRASPRKPVHSTPVGAAALPLHRPHRRPLPVLYAHRLLQVVRRGRGRRVQGRRDRLRAVQRRAHGFAATWRAPGPVAHAGEGTATKPKRRTGWTSW